MAIAKIIEIKADGDTVEAAVEAAVAEASKTVRNIQSVWVKDIQAHLENGSVAHYRVGTKVTFLVQGGQHSA